MPITINGSGTVTGISAGGLPDGVITRAEMGYAGAILQVVNATYSTATSNSTSTYADTGLTASITPSSASSKILIIVSQVGLYKSNNNTQSGVNLKLFRGATELSIFARYQGFTNTAFNLAAGTASINYLDSPSTTSSVTYKTQFANDANASSVSVQSGSDMSTITLLEVAA